MMKKVIVLLILFSAICTGFALPARAATCRQTAAHTVCILSIERSAKNYWEYRAAVKVDAETRPVEVYNCRERIRVKRDGSTRPFEPNGAGEVICTLFKAPT
jgi:CO dehydrogenase/acetyl-CoA synthase beta subunit